MGNASQQRCPKCGKLPREYKDIANRSPLGGGGTFTPAELWDLIFSPLHVGLRSIDGLLRLSGLVYIDHPTCTAAHLDRYNQNFTRIQDVYMNRPGHKKLAIKFITPDGGDTLNGWHF